MDFGFAPGTFNGRRLRNTPQDRRVRNMFDRRSNTTLITKTRRRSTVRQFILHLSNHASISLPVEDLLIGTHANSNGFLFIPLYPGQRGHTNYEALEETINTNSHSISIPDAVIGYTSGDSITHSFDIKGCNIGQQVPFLIKLKEALGDHVKVTAPKHFHFLFDQRRFGTIEGMAYEFSILRSTAISNRADLISAFQTETGLTYYDGSNIPSISWDSWLPIRLRRNDLRRRRRLNRRNTVNLGQSIGRRSTLRNNIGFRTEREQFSYTIAYPRPSDVPSSNADRMIALREQLGEIDSFDSSHDFPQYERWGYSSFNDFMAGYNWRLRKRGRRLICIGTRFKYTVILPILDTSTDNLIFNYYPHSRSGNTEILSTDLVVTNSNFFQTV